MTSESIHRIKRQCSTCLYWHLTRGEFPLDEIERFLGACLLPRIGEGITLETSAAHLCLDWEFRAKVFEPKAFEPRFPCLN